MNQSIPLVLTLALMPPPVWGIEPATARLAQLDRDRDRQISLQEAEGLAHLYQHFDQFDKNLDGFLNLVELVQYEALYHTGAVDRQEPSPASVE